MNLRYVLIYLAFNLIAFAAHAETWQVKQDCKYIPDSLVLKYEVEIRPQHSEQLDALIHRCPSLKTLELQLNSPGGSVYETLKIKAVLDQAKQRGITVVTQVTNGDECASNCVPLFAQGDQRRAGEVSAFMFHGVSIAIISNIPEKEGTEQMLSMIRPSVDSRWLQGLIDMEVFSIPAMYWLSGKELFEQQSGLVTELLTRYQKFQPYNRTYRGPL